MKFITTIFLLLLAPLAIAQTHFNDESLDLLLKDSKAGIIFSWSPFMPLSLKGLEEIYEIAKSNNIALEILIDPHPLILFESTDALLHSQVLIDMGMLNHFPSIVLYKNGSLLPWMIQGYESKKSLEMLIKTKLREL